MKLQIQPIGSNVLIRLMKRTGETITEGGIKIPDEYAKNYRLHLCRVLAVGDGRQLPTGEVVPLRVKVGDVVIVSREPLHLPNEIDQELMALVDESAISAVIAGGLDTENYQEGVTLLEEYENAQSAQAEREHQEIQRRSGRHIIPA